MKKQQSQAGSFGDLKKLQQRKVNSLMMGVGARDTLRKMLARAAGSNKLLS